MRWQGERGFAILVGRWRTLRPSTASPRQVHHTDIAVSLVVTSRQNRIARGAGFPISQGGRRQPRATQAVETHQRERSLEGRLSKPSNPMTGVRTPNLSETRVLVTRRRVEQE
jgi:hypothetical protein